MLGDDLDVTNAIPHPVDMTHVTILVY